MFEPQPHTIDPPVITRELPGGTAVWLFVAVELLTFGLFFVGFASARRGVLANREGNAPDDELCSKEWTCARLTVNRDERSHRHGL